jgi:hypothetical protein
MEIDVKTFFKTALKGEQDDFFPSEYLGDFKYYQISDNKEETIFASDNAKLLETGFSRY